MHRVTNRVDASSMGWRIDSAPPQTNSGDAPSSCESFANRCLIGCLPTDSRVHAARFKSLRQAFVGKKSSRKSAHLDWCGAQTGEAMRVEKSFRLFRRRLVEADCSQRHATSCDAERKSRSVKKPH